MGKYINVKEIFELSSEQVLNALNVTGNGLSTTEARKRKERFGPNKLLESKEHPFVIELLSHVVNPLNAILLIASIFSIYRGDVVNASIIALIVIIGIVIDYLQNHRALITLKNLRIRFSLKSTILRDEKWSEVIATDIVPGDIIELTAGDSLPADVMLLTSKDLHVQQAILTGESLPIEKEVRIKNSKRTDNVQALSPIQYGNIVFAGSSILSGHATALVFSTGKDTLLAEITKSVNVAPPRTEFEIGINKFGIFILKTIIFIILSILLISVYIKRNVLDTLLFAVALSVGLTPEFLPMITTVTLAAGAIRMSHKKVIFKNLAAIQNLGSIDILCSDKTGTITTGEMVLENHVDMQNNPSQKVLLMAYINSYYQTGVKNLIDEVILKKTSANRLDNAIKKHEHHLIQNYIKIDEIPFDFERRRASIIIEMKDKMERLLVTKGAPEYIFKLCNSYELNGKVFSIDATTTQEFYNFFHSMSEEGYRILSVAYRNMPIKTDYHVDDEAELIFLGFLIFSDPPLSDAKEVIHLLRKMKVEVKILTGDNEKVAKNICQKVGIDVGSVMLGSEVESMPYPLLEKKVEKVKLFARITPNQKQKIVSALRRNGHVVGFIGDGVNDVGALHSSDIGISTFNAADAAKEAANVILLERKLKVILSGIQEGRRAFGNVMKYLMMSTSSNFGNMLSMAVSILFLPFFPMLPTQILLNNLLYDISQIAIPTDKVDRHFKYKPSHWDISIIRRSMFYIGSISSLFDFITFYVLLKFFSATESLFQTSWFIESLATQILVIFVIRTTGNPFKNLPSTPLVCTIIATLCIGILLPFSPLKAFLGFTSLPFSYLIFLGCITIVYLFTIYFIKQKLMSDTST